MTNYKKNRVVHDAKTLSSLSSLLYLKKSTLSSLLSSAPSKPTTNRKKKINKKVFRSFEANRSTDPRKKTVFSKVNTLLTSDFRLLKILMSNILMSRGRGSVYKIFKYRRKALLSDRKTFKGVPVSASSELTALGISWRFYRSILARLHPSTNFKKSLFYQTPRRALNAEELTGTGSEYLERAERSFTDSNQVLTFPDYWFNTTRFNLYTTSPISETLSAVQTPAVSNLSNSNVLFPVFLSWVAFWTSALALYSNFSATPFIQKYLKDSFIKVERPTHQLRFRFNKSRLTLALFQDFTMKPYFQISSGVFMKFFQKKKSMRKSRTLKVLMLRFLRKLLLLIKLPRIHLYVSGVPALLGLLLETLHKPLPHVITDPLTKRLIDEVNEPESFGSFSQITFNDSKPFGIVKQKKRGRVKRKIRRKLQRISKNIDK